VLYSQGLTLVSRLHRVNGHLYLPVCFFFNSPADAFRLATHVQCHLHHSFVITATWTTCGELYSLCMQVVVVTKCAIYMALKMSEKTKYDYKWIYKSFDESRWSWTRNELDTTADMILINRSCWPRGLRHELSPSARTLVSWVRNPLEAWVYCLRLSCA
jgi:hypothetical protein